MQSDEIAEFIAFKDFGAILRIFSEHRLQSVPRALLAFAHHGTAIARFASIIGHQRDIGVRILRIVVRDHLLGDGQLAHRSHSPKTISSAPMIAVVSASIWPRDMKSMACRCEKAVGLILQR